MGKVRAIAMITDPTAVAAKRTALGQTQNHKGAIYCSIPELGFEGVNLVYCRYGLSIPYIQVQVGWTLWVEATIDSLVGGTDRWVYTGFADCGDSITPATADQMLIQLLSQVIYASTAGTIHLSSKTATEALIKGTTALVELTKHQTMIEELQSAISGWTAVPNDGGAALKVALATFLGLPTPDYSSILSTKVFTE